MWEYMAKREMACISARLFYRLRLTKEPFAVSEREFIVTKKREELGNVGKRASEGAE